jgi:hypothetical protein
VFTPNTGTHDSIPTLPRGTWGTNSHFCEWNRLGFDSKHEVAFAQLLCRYLPSFELIPKVTYQVAVGGARVDFCVNDVLVEYHPALPFFKQIGRHGKMGDFTSREEYTAYRRTLESFGDDSAAKDEYRREIVTKLECDYVERRTSLIRQESSDKRELVFVHTPEQFYLKIFARMGSDLPGLREFCGMFDAIRSGYSARRGRGWSF